MAECITLGKFNKNYYYMLLTGLFSILTDSIYGYKLSDSFSIIQLFDDKTQIQLYNHLAIHELFRYIGLLIILLIIRLYKNFKNKNYSKRDKYSNLKGNKNVKFIHTSLKRQIQKKLNLTIIITISIWILQFYLAKIFIRSSFKDLDFWMFELLIVSFLNLKIFNYRLYKHQKCAIYYNTIVCTLLSIISLIISISVNEIDKNSIFAKETYFIPIGIIFYFIILIARSYSICKIKYLIDLKYITANKILSYASLLGIIIFTFILFLESFIKCPNLTEKIDLDFCLVSYENESVSYLDNFIIYFKVLINANSQEIISEIIINILGSFCYFLYLNYYSLILEYLTPIHYIFSSAIYYLLNQLIFILYHKLKNGYYFGGKKEYTALKFHKFLINLFSNIFACFGFLVYLEIIELNCYGLNYNLKRKIIERSIEEKLTIGIYDDSQIDLEESKIL